MGAARSSITVVDRSTLIAALDGIYGMIAIQSERGPTEPRLVSSQSDLKEKYGAPNLQLGVGYFSAKGYLTQSNKLWVNRVVSQDARLSAILVKGKINNRLSDTDGIPSPDFSPELITIPYSRMVDGTLVKGMAQGDLDTFVFESYPASRRYEQLNNTIIGDVNKSNKIRVNLNSNFTVGDILTIKASDPGDTDPLYTITGKSTETKHLHRIRVGTNINTSTGDKVFKVSEKATPITTKIAQNSVASENSIRVQAHAEFSVNDIIRITEGDKTAELVVASKNEGENKITFKSNVGQVFTTQATMAKIVYTPRDLGATVTKSVVSSNEVLVTSSDNILNGDTITFLTSSGDFDPATSAKSTVVTKDLFEEEWLYITIDQSITTSASNKFFKLISSEVEERDAMIVVAQNPGSWGNNISVAIAENTTLDHGFDVIVYEGGVEVERHSGTPHHNVDGYGTQTFIEEVINNNSSYINVKYNTAFKDEDGKALPPLFTTYSLWRQDPVEIFSSYETKVQTVEQVLYGDTKITVNNHTSVSEGDRIKFKFDDGVDTYYSSEYKVKTKTTDDGTDTGKPTLVLDRGYLETDLVAPVDAEIVRYNPKANIEDEGIYEGKQYYAITKLNNTYPANTAGDKVYRNVLDDDGNTVQTRGTLLDAGTNLMIGGTLGSPATQADYIKAYQMFNNTTKYPGMIMMDGGYTTPAFAKALYEVVKARGNTHLCLSSRIADERSSDYLNKIVEYFKNQVGIDDHCVSFYTGWCDYFDPDLQLTVQVSPEAMAAGAQSYVTQNYSVFYPSGGPETGKVSYVLNPIRVFSDADLDYLVDNRINPIVDNDGIICIWGNETSYRKSSPMQIRSVSYLILYIRESIAAMLKTQLFKPNTTGVYGQIQSAIEKFMNDEIMGNDGVYSYKVAVEEVTTDTDVDNRRVKVFLGIQPTTDIKTVDCRIAIFGKSNEVTVSWN